MFKRMKNLLQRSSRKQLVVLGGALVLVVAGLTVSAQTWGGMLMGSATAQEQAQEQGLIRLLTSGFSQTQFTGAAGQYRLVMTRASANEAVTLQLKNATGAVVQEVVMPQERSDWTTLIELPAGSYTLTVTNHPDWACQLTVQ